MAHPLTREQGKYLSPAVCVACARAPDCTMHLACGSLAIWRCAKRPALAKWDFSWTQSKKSPTRWSLVEMGAAAHGCIEGQSSKLSWPNEGRTHQLDRMAEQPTQQMQLHIAVMMSFHLKLVIKSANDISCPTLVWLVRLYGMATNTFDMRAAIKALPEHCHCHLHIRVYTPCMEFVLTAHRSYRIT